MACALAKQRGRCHSPGRQRAPAQPLTLPCATLCCPLPPPLAGGIIDAEARARTRTLYLPFGAVPMFPEALAEAAFSLGAGGGDSDGRPPLNCALSIGVALSEDGAIGSYEVVPSLVRVGHPLTYDEADADIALGPGGCAHPELQALYGLARLRWGLWVWCWWQALFCRLWFLGRWEMAVWVAQAAERAGTAWRGLACLHARGCTSSVTFHRCLLHPHLRPQQCAPSHCSSLPHLAASRPPCA